jgi:hypothetical protein
MTGRGAVSNRDRLQKVSDIFALPSKRTAFGWQSVLPKIPGKSGLILTPVFANPTIFLVKTV